MAKLRYVIDVDTQRLPHEIVDGKYVLSGVVGREVLTVLHDANLSFSVRNSIAHKGVNIKSVEVIEE